MNIKTSDGLPNWLFLDLNSFFASCEQQDNPAWRGRPVAVVPSLVDTTCCIAASYEAKRRGVKTGTLVREARKLIPDIILVTGNHRRYVEYHHRVIAAFESCLPVDSVMSIDEFAGCLIGRNREPARALEIARNIKAAIARDVGECLTSSIGIAPNRFLAKVASDLEKPNGLTLLTKDDLPHALSKMELRDIVGIGRNMEERLHRVGIGSVDELCAAPPYLLKAAWGGVNGLRMHALLRGDNIEPLPTQTRCLSHEHVLEPKLRTPEAAYQYLRYLLMKGAQRLREKNYATRHLSVHMKWLDGYGREDYSVQFHQTQSSAQLLQRLEEIWQRIPRRRPLRIGIVLSGLVPMTHEQFDLFAEPPVVRERESKLQNSLDTINKRFGSGTVGFGVVKKMLNGGVESRIAFQRVPDLSEFERT